MKKRPGRLALWLLTLAVFSLLYLQDRPVSLTGEKVAFLPGGRAGQDGVTFRIEGNCVKSGVYRFDHTIPLGTVINMTVPFCQEFFRNQGSFKNLIYNGDVLLVKCRDWKHAEIKRETMQVVEKMILGIPLDPNSLTVDEWEILPQIGPTLAKKIVADRQENGDFESISDLERVSGIGDATVKHLEGYFTQNVVY